SWICKKGRILVVCFSMVSFLPCAFISFLKFLLLARFCLIFWNNFICLIEIFLSVFFLKTLLSRILTSFFMFSLTLFKSFIMMGSSPFHLELFISYFIFIYRMINACFMSEHQYDRFVVSLPRIVTAW